MLFVVIVCRLILNPFRPRGFLPPRLYSHPRDTPLRSFMNARTIHGYNGVLDDFPEYYIPRTPQLVAAAGIFNRKGSSPEACNSTSLLILPSLRTCLNVQLKLSHPPSPSRQNPASRNSATTVSLATSTLENLHLKTMSATSTAAPLRVALVGGGLGGLAFGITILRAIERLVWDLSN